MATEAIVYMGPPCHCDVCGCCKTTGGRCKLTCGCDCCREHHHLAKNKTEEELHEMHVHDLREFIETHGGSTDGCIEKEDLLQRALPFAIK